MTEPIEPAGRLQRLTAIASAPSAAEALERVLDAAGDVTPRAALFLVRAGRLRGWRCVGYEDACLRRLPRLDLDGAHGWLAPLFDPAAPSIVERGAGEHTPDFGQLHAEEAMATSLRAGPTTVAVVVAERFRGQEPWGPVSFGTLGILGSMRLALDLARRRPEPAMSPSSSRDAEHESAPEFYAELPPPRVEAETGLVALDEVETKPPGTARQRDAKRFARLVASDIRLYNEEAVLTGRSRRDLVIRLHNALARGRESFLRRFPELGAEGLEILDDAYVEVLAGGDAALLQR